MKTLAELRGSSKFPTGKFGIEIETEAKSGYLIGIQDFDKYWESKADGSLRDVGMEYVLTKPLNYRSDDYKRALSLFEELTKKVKFIHSVYSSLHVHVNMMNETPLVLANFISLFFLMEEVLNHYCGPDRNGNLFCLKTASAETNFLIIKDLLKYIDSGSYSYGFTSLNPNSIKYSGLNVATLRHLGSVEIRIHGGTTDVSEIDIWVGIINKLLLSSKKFKSPAAILHAFRWKYSYKSFLESIFEEYSYLLSTKVFEEKIKNPLYYLSSISTLVADWSNFGSKEEEKKRLPRSTRIKSSAAPIGLTSQLVPSDDTEVQSLNEIIGYYNEIIGSTTNLSSFTLDEDL